MSIKTRTEQRTASRSLLAEAEAFGHATRTLHRVAATAAIIAFLGIAYLWYYITIYDQFMTNL
ncbi:hypothetical protein [Moorena sp. SIO3A5]|uniref:hypothetical protein n=1 Tax=Moorena sp. SIO3A5 TaxID=2607822 RepID=UPI00031AD7E8|nr:hypothetical protein [Moorena sp. SIO3A5]NEP69380.1 hypothetical protein [Moorena sp. SIO3A5]